MKARTYKIVKLHDQGFVSYEWTAADVKGNIRTGVSPDEYSAAQAIAAVTDGYMPQPVSKPQEAY